jgi:hypothetical protein
MNNSAVIVCSAVALYCVEVAKNHGVLPVLLTMIIAAALFVLMGRAIQKKIDGKR